MSSALLCLAVIMLQGVCLVAVLTEGTNSISWPFAAHARSNRTTVGSSISSVTVIPLLNSTNEHFAWGWVAIPNNEYLLSIVYMPGSSMDAQQVWVTNRNRPVKENALVQLDANGELTLKDADGLVVWTSMAASTGATLTLQDQGNLVLLTSRGNVVWQSFDHPSDTLLPGQVIATGTQVIASASYSNATEGRYSVAMEQGGLIMYVATPGGLLPYHVVGFSSVDKNNTVESVQHPACMGTSMAYSSGGGEVIFRQSGISGCNHSSVIPVGSNDNNTSIFFRLDPDGNFRTYVYRPHYGWGIDQEIFSGSLYCALPGRCGSYGVCSSYGSCSCPLMSSSDNDLFRAKNPSDPSSGCVLLDPQSCFGDKGVNQFVELQGAHYFANDFTYQNTSTLEYCKSACALSCNCTVAFYQQNTGSCFHYQFVMSIQKVADTSFLAYVKVGDNSSSSSSSDTVAPSAHAVNGTFPTYMIIVVIMVSAFIALLCVLSCTLLGIKVRRRLADMHADDKFLESLPGLPTRFSYKELNKATERFSRRLGSGGFGSVYEGKLADGSRVAVKRLEGARQGLKEFHAEVNALGSINHLNLVRLRGFCTQRSQCLLVYDHVIHGSLDTWLFSASKFLDWPRRYNVALDTSKGLAFLHEESRECIVHLDIKPQNILLDENFVAKLSDFGLSKLIDRGDSDVVTNMRGTPGYVAPEWLLQAAVTSKSDVYSFGMVLLELVSGRRNLDMSRNTFWYFPAWAVVMVEEGKMMDIVDERLVDGGMTGNVWKEVERVIKVAMWCIQEDPNIRPCMTTVVRILEGHADVEDAPSLLQFAMRIRSAAKVSSSSSNQIIIPSYSTDMTVASTHISNSVLSGPR